MTDSSPRWIFAGRDALMPPPRRRWFVVFRPRINPHGWLLAGWHLQIDWKPGTFRLPRLRARFFRLPVMDAPAWRKANG